MLRMLLLGRNGQVGWELARALQPIGEVIALGRDEADLSQPESLREVVARHRPDVIVNAAAYTAVDRAESEPDLARAVNTDAPRVLAKAARELGAVLVHYSTDYVFGGDGEHAFTEDDRTAPRNVYGQTKRDGEDAIRASGARHLILRTSWVFGAHGGNFVRTMLRLARDRDQLRVVADQIGAPTAAHTIADITAHCLARLPEDGSLDGTYHLAASGHTSWHGLASAAIEFARSLPGGDALKAHDIAAIATVEYPLPAARPANSRLSCEKLARAFGLRLPGWQGEVERVTRQLWEQR